MRSYSLLVLFAFAAIVSVALGNIFNVTEEKPKATNQWVVRIAQGSNVDEIAAKHGFRNLGKVGSLEDYYVFEKLKTRGFQPDLSTNDQVIFQERQIARRRYKRAVMINDPMYSAQWHLGSDGVGLNVPPVWNTGNLGRGVTVAVVDDGLEPNNNDIAQNYRADTSYDFNENDNDPNPFTGDEHGTSSAGCVAAASNSFCGVGVAPEAKVSGIRLIAAATVDVTEASALSYKTNDNHIFTCSWGPFDDGNRFEGPGNALKAAMVQSIQNGRNGKGTIYIWAGGNGRRNGDNCNYDGYVNSRYTIGIGAVGNNGVVAWYSEACSALFACAPSSGSTKRIVTSDLNGARGSSPTDCNPNFGGTSAAAPIAAGVVALMLSANPSLSWRDVQHIIANTSRIVDGNDGDWFTNKGGYHHNHNYGFGLLNTAALVEYSAHWNSVPAEVSYSFTRTIQQAIPTATYLTVNFDITDANFDFIEHIELSMKVTSQRKGGLSTILSNSFGTKSILTVPHGDNTPFPPQGWTFGSVRHWGEAVNQQWKIEIKDQNSATSVFQSFTITFFGYKR